MAFLNNVAFRPSCIVSALPKRFRLALEKELGDSVAISTCRVEQLENAVKLRGATIAVVGASNESFDIAERLSHESHSVKVYLVHYQDSLSARGEMNGFAGIFDLRVEHERLAESIRQEALHPTRHLHLPPVDSKKPSRSRLLHHFITMQERLSNPQILMELMLDGFLEVAATHSGVLLVPSDSSPNEFKVLASRGEDAPQVSEHVTEEVTLEMLTGATLFFPEGISYSSDNSWSMGFDFSVGVPLVVNNKLLGCLLAKTNEASDNLVDYGAGASHILSQLQHREAATQRERLISHARQHVMPGWLLANAEGRVVYREGERANLLCNSFSQITAPRLKHALAEAQSGQSGSITFHDFLISYQPIRLNDAVYALLSFGEKNPSKETCYAPGTKITHEFIRFIQLQLGDSVEKSAFIDTILQDLQTETEKRRIVNLEVLSPLGIQFVADRKDIPGKITGGLALLLLAFARIVGDKASYSFTRDEDKWAVTFEYKEDALCDGQTNMASALPEHSLVKLILQITGFQTQGYNWRFSTYGGRFECRMCAD